MYDSYNSDEYFFTNDITFLMEINRAKILLVTTDKSFLEISTLLCFCDQANFTKTFKNVVGITPTQYRNQK